MLPLEQEGLSAPLVQIFANPTARGFRISQLQRLTAELGRDSRVMVSTSGPGIDLELDPQASAVWAFGGDGTARHVASAAASSTRTLPIGIYPAGTVNLLAREMAGRAERDGANAKCVIESHYPALLNGKLFLTCASVGPDSASVNMVSPALKRRLGRYAYLLAFLLLLGRWPRHSMRLIWTGGTLACEAIYIAKGRYFAGPWSFAPTSDVMKPELHIVALPKATRRAYFRFLLAMLANRIDKCDDLVCLTCTEIRIESEGSPVPVQADGDIVSTLPATISVAPIAMPFFSPSGIAAA